MDITQKRTAFSNYPGILNTLLFLFMSLLLFSTTAMQLLGGEFTSPDLLSMPMRFDNIGIAFLTMFQVIFPYKKYYFFWRKAYL